MFGRIGLFKKQEKIYLGEFQNDRKNGYGMYLINKDSLIVGKFYEGELEGLALIFNNGNLEIICSMINTKVVKVINNEAERRIVKEGHEYLKIIDFYKTNIDTLNKIYIV